jgi:hypothetical protein
VELEKQTIDDMSGEFRHVLKADRDDTPHPTSGQIVIDHHTKTESTARKEKPRINGGGKEMEIVYSFLLSEQQLENEAKMEPGSQEGDSDDSVDIPLLESVDREEED